MSLSKTKISSCILSIVLASFILLDGKRPVIADYYKYTDKTGAVCITNNIKSVPQRYRSIMKVIREETRAKKDRATRIDSSQETPDQSTAGAVPQMRDVAPAEPASLLARLTSGASWKKPTLIACVFVSLFLIVRKLSAVLPSALLAKVIYLAFFLGTFVFLYKSYTEYITNSFITIKTKMISMFEKSNRREEPNSLNNQLKEDQ